MASSAPAQPSVHSTHPFTCNTCQVAFRSGDLQRAHMQTDWHRYNLKRRVAELPPLSSEIFTEKVLANKATAAASAAKAAFEKTCGPCQKNYFSENAYNNHLNSSKHKSTVARASRHDDASSVAGSIQSSAFSLGEPMAGHGTNGIDAEAEKEFSSVVDGIKKTNLEDGTDEPVAAEDRPQNPLSRTASQATTTTAREADPLLDCLFCSYRSPNFNLNLHHMGRFHGMFVPERDFLTEPENLIKYLHRKIHEYNQCLKCHKQLHTAAGIQTHMRDRGHCMIAFESDDELVEVGEFYDFRSSYPDAANFDAMVEGDSDEEEESDDSTSTADGGVKLEAPKPKRKTKTKKPKVPVDGEEDEGWETDSSTVSSVPTDEITSVPIDRSYSKLSQSRHHTHKDPRPHRNTDGFHSHAHPTPVAVYHDEYELHLPTGRTAGHRSLNKYYRQNLRNYPGVAERMEHQQFIAAGGDHNSDEEGNTHRQLDRHARRGRGMELTTRENGGTGMLGVSELQKKQVRAVEKREQKNQRRHQTNYLAGNEKRGNFQQHFRDHLLQ